ncbi:unnamed protein product [Adineta ricciae]|uniref:MANSC domain-containing protein n=1 Tax=Adineta ricciae TaxID=249248 RepID=A0A814L9V9_ADIRI|nr:unnamed protein product [Adineta ricciae]
MTIHRLISLVLIICLSILNCCQSKSNNLDVCSLWSDKEKNSNELKSFIFTNVKPEGGSDAGRFSKIKVNSWEECVNQCCQFNRCNVVYWIASVCVHIECISDEICAPVEANLNEETMYLRVRSVQSTAAALDYEDPGRDECNDTKLCKINEQCEQISVSAQIQRNICSCDHKSGYRRINGVCRQYLPNTKPCAIYEKDFQETDDNEDLDQTVNRGRCKKNEECLPPNDRAKHGYCQCKLGFLRTSGNGKCLADERMTTFTTSTPTTSISSSFDLEVQAGDDQTISLPTDQVDLSGQVLYKSNKTKIEMSILANRNLSLFWILKSSTNGAKINLINQENSQSHIVVKQLREGIYEFELQLKNREGIVLATDVMKVQVIPTTTTAPPLSIQIASPVSVRLPQQVVKLDAHVEPSSRPVTYQWTYSKDGPIIPILEGTDTSALSVSNLRPGNYSFRLHVVDSLGNEQTKTVQLNAIGEPIEARVANRREIVFWPSNDVVLDGTPSIIEQQTQISWKLLSNDNKQRLNEIDILSPHSLKTRVSNLRIGQYKFQLTLTTNDEEYTSKKDVLVVVYTQNGKPPKVSINLETSRVNILNNLIILNGSATTADYGIDRWQWKKSPSSPAIGNFLNNSDRSPMAYVTNLIEGSYVFILQVYDDRQQMSEANITVRVGGIPNAEQLVEIIFLSKPYLHQQTLDNLLAQIRVFLIDILPNIDIVMIGMPKENTLLIKAIDSKTNAIVSPKLVANHLQDKIKSLRSASNMNIISIDTYLCLSNCSNHGKCDHKTKHCVCNRYRMENWFKSLVQKEPNCDFIVHYVVLISIVTVIFALLFCWLCLCCCLRWRRRRNLLERRKRIRYQLLHEDDEDINDTESPRSPKEKLKSKFRLTKKNKTKPSNLIISESDCDVSDEHGEQTLYDKPLLTAKLQMSSSFGKNRGLKVPVQDSNGSPMLRNSGQSPTTTDNSVA